MAQEAPALPLRWVGSGQPDGGQAGSGESARIVKVCHSLFLGVVSATMAKVTVLAQRRLIRGLVGHGFGGVDFAAFTQQEAEAAGLSRESEHADVSAALVPDYP